MKRRIIIFLAFGIISCNSNKEIRKEEKTGSFSGLIEQGNFSDKISFEIEQDSNSFKVFFTSLEQNTNRIPFQGVKLMGDSINFKLQSDFILIPLKTNGLKITANFRGLSLLTQLQFPTL